VPWNWTSGAPVDPRRDLRVFTVMPNWKDGVLENLSWLTDVLSSEIGTEQRRGSRRYPRRSFEAGFLRTGAARARIDNYLSAVGRAVGMVPLWHEQYPLGVASLDGSVTFPVGTLATREFRLGDLVMVTAGNPDVYDVLTVTAHDTLTDTIMLQGLTAIGPWPEKSRIIPLRRARLLEWSKLSNVSDRVGVSQLRFTLSDVDTQFIASWGYCAPLWRFKPDRQDAIEVDYMRSDFPLDFEAGVIDVLDPSNRAQIVMSMKVKMFNRAQVHAFRAFLYMARGRAVRFYVPTFNDDIQALGNMAGPTFDGKINGYSEYHEVPQEARRIVGVVFKDGRPTIYRNIVTTAPIASGVPPFRQIGERFTLDQDMPPILADDIERMMFVVPSRFDGDSIDIAHAVSGSHAATSAVVVRSSVVAGMPPIECWVTSWTYPLFVMEEMTSNVTLTGAAFSVQPFVLDAVESSMVLTAGTISTSVFHATEMLDEAVESSMVLTAGTIKTVLLATDMADEALESNIALTDATIKAVLISHIIEAEALSSNVVLTQGTLT